MSFKHATSWTAPGTAFLVTLDSNGQPVLMGSSTQTGYQALAAYDTNGDGVINSKDAGFSQLYLWNDTNRDGVLQAGELESLSAAGIASISLAAVADGEDINGNTVVSTSTVTMTDGTTREAADVDLQVSPTYTQLANPPAISDAIAALPQLHGYGTTADLHSAMVTDSKLQQLVQAFTQLPTNATYATLAGAVDSILVEWAGQNPLFPNTGDVVGDTLLTQGQLAVIDGLVGENVYFQGHQSYTNPGRPAVADLQAAWSAIEMSTVARLALQGPYSALTSDFTFYADLDAISPNKPMGDVMSDLVAQFGALTPDTAGQWQVAAAILESVRSDFGVSVDEFTASLGAQSPNLLGFLAAFGQGIQVTVNTDGSLLEQGMPIGGNEYVWQGGDGALVVSEHDTIPFSTPAANTLRLGGVTPGQLAESVSGNDLVFTAGGQTIIVQDQLARPAAGQDGIQTLALDGGFQFGGASETAIAGETALFGLQPGVVFDPAGIATTITSVGYGNIVDFDAGYGSVRLNLNGGGATVVFGSGITLVGLSLTAQANGDLVLATGGSGDGITLTGGANTPQPLLLRFSDGSSAMVMDSQLQQVGSNAPDTVVLQANQSVAGYARTNDFTLAAGATAIGAGQTDSFTLPSGVASATIVLSSGATNQVVLDDGFVSDGIRATANDNGDMVLSSGGRVLTIENARGATLSFANASGTWSGSFGSAAAPFSVPDSGSGVLQGADWGINHFLVGADVTDVITGPNADTVEIEDGVKSVFVTASGQDNLVLDGKWGASGLSFSVDASNDVTVTDLATGNRVGLLAVFQGSGQSAWSRTGTITDANGSLQLLGQSFAEHGTGASDLWATPFGSAVEYLDGPTGTAHGHQAGDLFATAGSIFVVSAGTHTIDQGSTGEQATVDLVAGFGSATINLGANAPVINWAGLVPSSLVATADTAGDLTLADGSGNLLTLNGEFRSNGQGGFYPLVGGITGTGSGSNLAISSLVADCEDGDTGQAGTVAGSPFLNSVIHVGASTTTATTVSGFQDTVDVASGATVSVSGGGSNNGYILTGTNAHLTVAYSGWGGELGIDDPSGLADCAFTTDSAGDLTITDAALGDSIVVRGMFQPGQTAQWPALPWFTTGEQGINTNRLTLTSVADANGNVTGSPFGPSNLLLVSNGSGTATAAGTTSNTLVDAPGSHTLIDAAPYASDTVVFHQGDGSLVVNAAATSGGTVLMEGTPRSSLSWSLDDATGNLTLTDGTGGDSVTWQHAVTTAFTATTSAIGWVGTSDGGTQVLGGLIPYSAEQDVLSASGGVNAIGSNARSDLFQLDGLESVQSGQGIQLAGGFQAVSNTYQWGNGADTVSIALGQSGSLQAAGSGMGRGSLWFSRDDNDLLVGQLGQTGTLRFQDLWQNQAGLGEVVAADGHELGSRAAIADLATAMTSYQSSHTGWSVASATAMPTDSSDLSAALSRDWW